MKKSNYLIVLFLVTLIAACSTRSGNEDNNTPEKANKKWTKEAQLQYKVLAYYYNNNIHDSLVMKVVASTSSGPTITIRGCCWVRNITSVARPIWPSK